MSAIDPSQTVIARETEIKAMIAAVMRKHADRLAGRKVFLFGSRAAGRARRNSDFDIGVDGMHPMAILDFFAIEDDLEALPTLHKIDWVDFGKVSAHFRQRAMQHIEVLYE